METRECCCIFYKKSEGMPRMMQTNSCKGTVYVVKEKDSLYKIAKAHGVRAVSYTHLTLPTTSRV